jgi:hypothetical protein
MAKPSVMLSAPEGQVPEVQITRGEYESAVVEPGDEKDTGTTE